MMIEDLERDGLVRRFSCDKKKVDDAMALAYRDLKTSRTILASDQDWAYTIAPSSSFQGGKLNLS